MVKDDCHPCLWFYTCQNILLLCAVPAIWILRECQNALLYNDIITFFVDMLTYLYFCYSYGIYRIMPDNIIFYIIWSFDGNMRLSVYKTIYSYHIQSLTVIYKVSGATLEVTIQVNHKCLQWPLSAVFYQMSIKMRSEMSSFFILCQSNSLKYIIL